MSDVETSDEKYDDGDWMLEELSAGMFLLFNIYIALNFQMSLANLHHPITIICQYHVQDISRQRMYVYFS